MAGFQLFNGKGNCNSCHVDGRSTLLSPNIADNWRPASRKSRLSPDTIKGYIELSSAGQKKDLLGAKIRELIALAVAVTARCDGCITVHTEAAITHGATKEEIAEALGVAVAVNAGAALVYSARVMDAFEEYPRAASADQ